MSFEDILKRGEQEIDDLLHRDRHTSAAQPAAAVTIKATTPGGPVSAFTEAKTILHDGLEKLEAIDEGAQNVVEAIKVNPTGVSIVNTVASVAHLPDPQGLLSSADVLLKSFAAALAKAAQDTAQAAQADAPADAQSFAGPAVGGQA
jgi:hypothetical protein